jgi:glycosyltransferase involved in cell wall biosynthesis
VKFFIFVPSDYKKIGGYYLPINKYLSVLEENGFEYKLYEIPVQMKEILKFDFNSINSKIKGEFFKDEIVIITFTLNIAYYISKKIDLSKKSVKSISFLMDSLNYYISSKINIHKRLGLEIDNILKYRIKQLNYYLKEKHVLHKYNDVVYVSPSDINFVEKYYTNISANLRLIPNGINLSYSKNDVLDSPKFKDKITLGFLGSATKGNFEDISWFVEKVFPKIVSKEPRIELVVAGRGPDEEMFTKYFRNIDKADYVGRFDELDEFYNNCDIVITTIRKSCGILNKVLEAFYFKKPVIGLPENFLSFPNAQESNNYLTFNNEKEFLEKIIYLQEDDNYNRIVDASYKYVIENYNWELSKEKFNEILFH